MFSRCVEKIKSYVAILLLAGCGTLVGNPEDDDANQHETSAEVAGPEAQIVTFKMADAPIDDAVSVFVTVKSVEIKPENGSWIIVPLLFEQEIDLLQYQDGASIAFAKTGAVEIGTYTNTRLVLSETILPRIVLADGTVKTMLVDSAGMTIDLDKSFVVTQGQPVDITFDFDLRKSLLTKGEGGSREYTLNPSLRMLKAGEFGAITGDAPEGRVVCVYPVEAVMDEDDSCENAVNSAKVKNGKYTLPYMSEGSYRVRVFDSVGAVKQVESEIEEHQVNPAAYKSDQGKRDDENGNPGASDDGENKEEKTMESKEKQGENVQNSDNQVHKNYKGKD